MIVPDRSDAWQFYAMCPLCLDEFLGIFPFTVRSIQMRELSGKWAKKRSVPFSKNKRSTPKG